MTVDRHKAAHPVLQLQVRSIQPSSIQSMMPNLDRASRLLQSLLALWNHPGVTPAQQQGLAMEVFQEVRLREGGWSRSDPDSDTHHCLSMRYGVSMLQMMRAYPNPV